MAGRALRNVCFTRAKPTKPRNGSSSQQAASSGRIADRTREHRWITAWSAIETSATRQIDQARLPTVWRIVSPHRLWATRRHTQRIPLQSALPPDDCCCCAVNGPALYYVTETLGSPLKKHRAKLDFLRMGNSAPEAMAVQKGKGTSFKSTKIGLCLRQAHPSVGNVTTCVTILELFL